jgi:UDP:flavonoid glycosyltransferase YjiC (YdhE family)
MSSRARELTYKRIIFTAVGSLGDLHPYIAIAIGRQARGHEAVIATSACYGRKIEGLGYSSLPSCNFMASMRTTAVSRQIISRALRAG